MGGAASIDKSRGLTPTDHCHIAASQAAGALSGIESGEIGLDVKTGVSKAVKQSGVQGFYDSPVLQDVGLG